MNRATRRRAFYPFPMLEGSGRLRVDAIAVDGRGVAVPETDGALVLSDLGDWTTLTLELTVTVPEELWARLPADERTPADVRVVVVAEDLGTGLRAVARLAPSPACWSGSLRLAARDLGEVVSLGGVVARTRASAPTEGLASELGARLLTTPLVQLRLRAPRDVAGSFMAIRWASFSGNPTLERRADLPWFLHLTADPPVLWLNNDRADTAQVLLSTGRTGPHAALREVLFRAIAASTWPTLFSAAVDAVREEDGEVRVPDDWRKHVLAVVAERVFVQLPKATRLQHLVRAVLDSRSAGGEPLDAIREEADAAWLTWLGLGDAIDRAAREHG